MGSHPLLTSGRPILFFDSACLLCNKSVQLVLKMDKRENVVFASLSNEIEKELLIENSIEEDSVVLYYLGKYYVKSSAILQLSKILGFPYSIFQVFYIVPKFVRDWMYDFIASHRKKWFGTTDHCIINSKEYSDRIIL